MIPLTYRLRDTVRFEKRKDSQIVVSELPLGIIRVSERGAQILQLCDGERPLQKVALAAGVNEEYVFRICEYFNKAGILEIMPSWGTGEPAAVTVIIPAKELHEDLDECLDSVFTQDYPKEKVEVIVIADGCPDAIPKAACNFPYKLISNPKSRGASYCRNLGAQSARGEILAFLDSDCVAEAVWLREITPYFVWERLGAVGGYVDGYFVGSSLDRYEKTFSPLNMGKHIRHSARDGSTAYVPTCNLLVRKDVYHALGGLREDLHVGEDVDLCWRMRDRGYDLLYVPQGSVKHKHRNSLGKMLKRRADYGTSEALLYSLHPEKKKVMQIPPLAAISLVAVCAAVLFTNSIFCMIAGACFVIESAVKIWRTVALHLGIRVRTILFSMVRTYFSFYYFVSFHLVRYYFLLLILGGFVFHPIWYVCFSMLIVAASVDYVTRRPNLFVLPFLFYYALEHIFYQVGVFVGCLRARSFESYVPRFVRRIV